MKKYVFYVLGFICLFFSFSLSISAKSETINDIRFNFGEDDILNMSYSNINSYKIIEDKSFYYNGVKYLFNDDYSRINDSIIVNDNIFTIGEDTLTLDRDNNLITSAIVHETYSLSVSIEFLNENSIVYEFSQRVCYKYNEINECNEDEGDITSIKQSSSYSYYYDFLPFYNETIKFDELTFIFTLKNGEAVTSSSLSFTKDEINYKDNFRVSGYSNVYIGSDHNYYLMASESSSGEVRANFYYTPTYVNNSGRVYSLDLYVCRGENYSVCGDPVFSSDKVLVSEWDVVNIVLPDLYYDAHDASLTYNSFKLKGEYVCIENCNNDSRAQKVKNSTNEEIYYLNVNNPIFKGTLDGVLVSCSIYYYYTDCYVLNKEGSNKVEFIDDNGISKVYYLISEKMINDGSLIVNEIDNGDSISITGQENVNKYVYYKVVDGSGYTTYYGPYMYYFDFTAPKVVKGSTNFDSYSSEEAYNDVNITIRYQDTLFDDSCYVYFKVINESDYGNLTKEEIIENDTYGSSVSIKEYIDSDGLYRVCFVGKDPVGNYSDYNCSNAYYLDITNLTKEEVSLSDPSGSYESSLNLNISIIGVDEGTNFRCGIFRIGAIVNKDNLSFNCSNKKDNVIEFSGEGSYHLWIYASDNVGNYSLLEFDNLYLLDNIAPRVSYIIEENNGYYSNNVKVNVNTIDLNEITTTSYQFYLSNYNESEFEHFSLDEGISYPFDYYGEYKLAIKVCDNLNNCDVYTNNDTFLIDTGKIKIELIGEEEITILRWGKYEEKGVIASKGINEVSVGYNIEGSVDSGNVGVYYLTYTSGTGMNMVSVTRKVIVKNSVPYIASLASLLVIGEAIILLRLFVKKRKNDSI